jgi:hypothetical protein
MNHHIRSYSEQPQIAAQVGNGNGGGQGENDLAQPRSFIRIHSDSQQSLDQLFNPTLTSSVPLRNRNLPSSFFNPSVKTHENGNHVLANNLHSRSISFDQRNPDVPQLHRPNFHLRTHSTLDSTSWVSNQQEAPQPIVAHQPMQDHQPTIMHEHAVQVQPNHHNQHQTATACNQHQTATACNQHQTATACNQHQTATAQTHQAVFYSSTQQTVAAADTTITPMVASSHSLHSRSVSYHHRPTPALEVHVNHGFHMRTHSSAAPAVSTCHHHHHHHQQQQVNSHHSSHQSLNHSTNGSAAAGWSSSGYSTDDMTSAGSGHTWNPGNQQQPASLAHNHHHDHHHMQVQQQAAHPIASQQCSYPW